MYCREYLRRLAVFCVTHGVISFLLALCILTTLLGTSARAGDGYIEIGRNDDVIESLYLPSIEDKGEYLTGWIKTILRNGKPVDGKIPHHAMRLWAVNKDGKQIQLLSAVVYDKDGEILFSDSLQFNPYRWEECVPGSYGESYWLAIKYAYSSEID